MCAAIEHSTWNSWWTAKMYSFVAQLCHDTYR